MGHGWHRGRVRLRSVSSRHGIMVKIRARCYYDNTCHWHPANFSCLLGHYGMEMSPVLVHAGHCWRHPLSGVMSPPGQCHRHGP
jgi:hypothetical protein